MAQGHARVHIYAHNGSPDILKLNIGSNVFGAINILFKKLQYSLFSPYESMVFNIAIVSLPTFKNT